MMDCIKALKTRRSIRKFKADPVAPGDLVQILDAGRLAATAGNFQPWEFIVVDDPDRIRALYEAALTQELLLTAPLVIVICVDPERSSQYGERGMNYYCHLDAANATQNMLLAAHALGYGGCWMGGFIEGRVKEALDIPENIRVVSLVPVGRPEGDPWNPPKRSLEEMLHKNRW